ncbi:MAG TPA: PIN domain-containing protein [Xanthobacteraceae bacterium]
MFAVTQIRQCWIGSADIPPEVALSIVTIAELQVEIERTVNPDRRAVLLHWITEEVRTRFEDHTLPLTVGILTEWLNLGRRNAVAGSTRAPADFLIAATARVHDLTIVTRNVRDFIGTGVLVYDPWKDKAHKTELA